MPRFERELAVPVLRHFGDLGYETQAEVPFNGRIADVLALRGEEVVAVELKLRDWRTAHRQAIAYQVACHRTYVALPLVVAGPLARRPLAAEAFAASGCGLLAVNHPAGDVREVFAARESARRLDFLGDHVARVARAPRRALLEERDDGDDE